MGNKVAAGGSTTSRAGTTTSSNPPLQPAGNNTRPSGQQSSYFATEPVQRPSYIPWGLSLARGYYAPIYYDMGYHSYGYWDDLGRWILWNAMMNHHRAYYSTGWVSNDYYPQQPQPVQSPSPYYTPAPANPVAYTPVNHESLFLKLLPFLCIIGLIAIGVLFMRHHAMSVAGVSHSFDSIPPPVSRLAANVSPAETSHAGMGVPGGLTPGSIIILTDPQSLEDSRKRGLGSNGIHFTVERTAIATDRENFGKWIFYWINDQVQPLLLMAKVCDGATDWRLYYRSMDFATARREDVITRGDKWLFEAPADENNFVPRQLTYTAEIDYQIDGKNIRYVRKPQGERQATAVENPPPGTGDLLATIVEYSSADEVENPELLVLEFGPGDATGEITLYSGCPINTSDIHIMQA